MALLTLRGLTGLAAALALAGAVVGVAWAQSDAERPTEREVKAAFLYNFARFVEWPASALAERDAFVVCVVGDDAFGAVLEEAVRDKSLHGKSVVVKRSRTAARAPSCNVLYIVELEGTNLPDLVRGLAAEPVLTVSDGERFAERGGMIQLRVEQNKVRFDVNAAATERAGLKASSQLLKLARVVR